MVKAPVCRLIAAGLLSLGLGACTSTVSIHGNPVPPEKLAMLQPGATTKDQVVGILGTPTSVSTFDAKTWYYIARTMEKTSFFNPELLDQQIVIVKFDDKNILADVHKADPNAAQDVAMAESVTPTPGKDQTVLQEIVGNIGRFTPNMGQNTVH